MTTEQIASAIVNDLYAGNVVKLDDRNHISIEQLEDEVIDCRNSLIKEMYIKGILNLSDSSLKTEKVESLSKKMIANV